MPEIVIITSGGDWADASFEVLEVPEGRNFEADKKAYPGYHQAGRLFLHDWLEKPCGFAFFLVCRCIFAGTGTTRSSDD